MYSLRTSNDFKINKEHQTKIPYILKGKDLNLSAFQAKIGEKRSKGFNDEQTGLSARALQTIAIKIRRKFIGSWARKVKAEK